MKNLLRFSVLANLALSALVLWLVRERRTAGPAVPTIAVPENHPQPIAAVEPARPPAPVPFRWSQLESTDYHTYLANLRGIGCPEQTVRDIITADVDGVFAQRREQVEQATGTGPANQQELQLQLQGLREQETSFLASLLGGAPGSSELAAHAPPPFQRAIRPVLPLALREINPAVMQLNSNQVAVIAAVRRQFQEQLGNQDPNDPAYVQRWNQAQRDADDRLRGMLGSKFYIQYQVEAANQASH